MEILDTQVEIRRLGEKLACLYAGAIPPGQVIGIVATTAHRLRRVGHRGRALVELTESSARTELVGRVGRSLAHGRQRAPLSWPR